MKVICDLRSEFPIELTIDLAPNVWLHSSVGRVLHRYHGGRGSNPVEALISVCYSESMINVTKKYIHMNCFISYY